MSVGERRRLHPAAIAVYSAAAFRGAIFPLVILVGMSLLGGGLDAHGLVRGAIYGALGVAISLVSGYVRWNTTTYWIADDAIHHHSGLLRQQDTKVPLERVEALDVHQGPLQRAFGVLAVEVQTGAAAKGGEISLPALTPGAVQELRAARPGAAAPVDAPAGPQRRLAGRDLAIAALTAGQLGLVLPVLAAAGQVVQQITDEKHGRREAERLLPHTVTAIVLVVL